MQTKNLKRIIPRILSVFNLLKRVGFALLLLGGAAVAQPLEVLWEREGLDDSSRYGSGVFALGDQNDDGFADWGVAGPTAYGGGFGGFPDPTPGRVELFFGGNPPAQEPYRVFGTIPDSMYWILGGHSLGDLNGDGYMDYGVTFSRDRDSDENGRDAIYFGGGDPQRAPDIVLRRGHPKHHLVQIGDFNGDGFDDLLDRNTEDDIAETQRIYFGSVEFDTFPDWSVHNFTVTQSAFPETWGDINGDGYVDLMIFQRTTNDLLRVFYGSQSPDTIPIDYGPFTQYGSIFTILPDLNNDGFDDYLTTQGDSYDLHTFLGNTELPSDPAFILRSPSGDYLSNRVGIGDFNNDGFNDFVGLDNTGGGAWWGVFNIYLGYSWLNRDPVITVYGRAQPYNLIGPFSAAGLGDVNGDGVDDFIVGTLHDDFDGMRGKAIVFAGDPSYHVPVGSNAPTIPNEIEINSSPNPFNSTTSISLILPPHAQGATLRIHNLLGQEVLARKLSANETEYLLDGAGLPTGIYLVTAQAADVAKTVKVMLLK